MTRAAMRSLALAFPDRARSNDYFRRNHPTIVAAADQKSLARLWAKAPASARPVDAFDAEMEPYLKDPFRGAVQRRVLAKDASPRSLELKAAKRAMEAAGLGPKDIDLMVVASFFPDQYYVGNASFLSQELALECGSWNLETACSGSVVGFRTASALVQAGEHQNVLVVTSCNYSQVAEETDTMSWFLGDGAAAFVVGQSPVPDGGYLGGKSVHTAATCGTFFMEMVVDPPGTPPRMRMLASERSGPVLRETSEPYLKACCEGAVKAAGVQLKDIDFFIFNTPTAWYAPFCARALGVDPARTINTYPMYANTGPVLMPTNLYHAAKDGMIKPGDLVLMYSVGSVSSASAAVMRWTGTSLAPGPDAVVTLE